MAAGERRAGPAHAACVNDFTSGDGFLAASDAHKRNRLMTSSSPRVLSIGNCGPDHGAIERLLRSRFDAVVEAAHSAQESLAAIQRQRYDLILVNRVFDHDGDSGLELLKRLKSAESAVSTPVMLISNFPEYQEQAVAVGAEPGFGKSSLQDPRTVERLARYLSKMQQHVSEE